MNHDSQEILHPAQTGNHKTRGETMSLLKMSVSGAVMILAVTVLRAAAVNHLPKKVFLTLWALVLVRLLIPYSLPCAFSVYSLAPAAETDFLFVQAVPAAPAAEMRGASGQTEPSVPSGPQDVNPRALIWLVGTAACAGFFTAAYWKCRRKFRESFPVENGEALEWLHAHRIRRAIELRRSSQVSAPLTYGVLRPVILLPRTVEQQDMEDLRFVLAHEYIHIRRFDAVTKLALAAAFCVHWFNPAVWLMYALANRDLELSCDEAVIRLFGERSKHAYAMALIHMSELRNGTAPLCSNFSKNAMEERIIAIMKMKKTSWISLTAAFILVAGVTTAFATSARRGNQETLDRALNGTAYEDTTMMSYVDPEDGKTYYSEDGGENWITEDEFDSRYPQDDIVWWTAEEYAAWLDNEKNELQDMIGERGWTPSTGWFTWDQQMVDETIAMYEGILEDIQNGALVSKSINGSDDAVLMIGAEESEYAMESDIDSDFLETFKKYEPFGVTFVQKGDFGNVYYNGGLVRSLNDHAPDGSYTTVGSIDEGGIDVETVYDANGKLTGIQPVNERETLRQN